MKNFLNCTKKLIVVFGITLISTQVSGQYINEAPSEVTLSHRILGPDKCANDACYFDFFYMQKEYGYGLSLEFGNDWGTNMFGGVQVVDEVALMADLGKMSCKDMGKNIEVESGRTKQDRIDNPMRWLVYTDAWSILQRGGKSDIPAKEGHCYLLYKASRDQKIIVAFHVKSLLKNESVTIDEIEVFQRAVIVEQF